MKPITIFSWGYWGWGNATRQLRDVVDAVEKARGFKPPLFVDIRFKRKGRAKGFVDDAFANVLRGGRYAHLSDLGNANIGTRKLRIKISKPSAAQCLLEIVLDRAEQNQRVLFFCACPWPKWDGIRDCHRDAVTTLLLRRARRQDKNIEIVEWPGGCPTAYSIEVTPAVYKGVRNGLQNVPLGHSIDFARIGALPWGTIVILESRAGSLPIITGPATYRDQWMLPLVEYVDKVASFADLARTAERIRRERGLSSRLV